MESCSPTQQRFSCARALSEAVAAYHQLLVGGSKVRVRHGETEVEYDRRNLTLLKGYIASLHQTCGGSESAAVLGIPTNRRPAPVVFSNTRLQEAGCGCQAPPKPHC